MKAGVSTAPCGVERRPARARPDVASSAKESMAPEYRVPPRGRRPRPGRLYKQVSAMLTGLPIPRAGGTEADASNQPWPERRDRATLGSFYINDYISTRADRSASDLRTPARKSLNTR